MLHYDKRIHIITGHYGSGKTNLAVNMALDFNKKGKKTCLVDLDIVNPYFRAADSRVMLEQLGIKVIAPIFANTNLDIPALPPAVYSVFNDKSYQVVLDVGGDDAGAAALGQYSGLIKEENNFEHYYVINARRALTQTPEETEQILKEIEFTSHLPVTALVNNTHLSSETDESIIRQSYPYAQEVSGLSSLPLAFTSVKRNVAEKLDTPEDASKEIYPVDIYVKTIWDQ